MISESQSDGYEKMIAGIDIGSRSIELVLLGDGNVVHREKTATTFQPLDQVRKLLDGASPARIIATGYGRNLIAGADMGVPVETITEIKAYALGAGRLHPGARTLLDIGGQDTKVISLAPGGRITKFEMNDRCAAGTGKFLEHMAHVFQMPVADFGPYALDGTNTLAINRMCTVFAETEAVSLMAQGHNPKNIARGLHAAIVRRTAAMLSRVGLAPPVLFAGGVARNPCVVKLLGESLPTPLLVPEDPDMLGAHGAALHGFRCCSPETT
jgi:predicted CoA-substrate-specific enzyme activase